MLLTFNIIKQKPNSIEKIELDDVSSYEVNDNEIKVKFNTSTDQVFPLRKNNGIEDEEWFGLSSFSTRVGLKIGENK